MSIQNYYGANCSSSNDFPIPFTNPPCTSRLLAINPQCQSLVKDTLEGFCKSPYVDHVSDPCDNCPDVRFHLCSSTHPNVHLCGETVVIPCSYEGYSDLSKKWKSTVTAPSSSVAKKITALGLLLLLTTGAIARLFIK